MLSRRLILAVGALAALPATAQPAGGFVGTWVGDVPNIGAAKLMVQQVRPTGQVEGRMEFELKSYVSTFADKADSTANTNRGMVDGSKLVIEAALGGTYELELAGNVLSGVYVRGTTLRVPVQFTRQ